jgi:hypothetical protein
MIGNDVVDLAVTKKENVKGVLDKILPKEQLLITSAINPETMVWNLWSRKEEHIYLQQRNRY